jgi:hypothetical protein
MEWTMMHRYRGMRCVSVLLVRSFVRADLCWMMITAWMLLGVVLLLVVAGATPSEKAEVWLDPDQQSILQAHPEWPPDVRAAVVAGIICAGMPADMVRVAWGRPTRTTGRGGPGQRETWHYEGRPSAVERLGGRGRGNHGPSEWTVSFVDGRVVGWTD